MSGSRAAHRRLDDLSGTEALGGSARPAARHRSAPAAADLGLRGHRRRGDAVLQGRLRRAARRQHAGHREHHLAFPGWRAEARHLPQHRRADGLERRARPLSLLRPDRRRGLEPVRGTRRLPGQRQRRRPGDPHRLAERVHQRHPGLRRLLHAARRAQPDHRRRQAGDEQRPGRHRRAQLQRLRHQRVHRAQRRADRGQGARRIDEGGLLPRPAGLDDRLHRPRRRPVDLLRGRSRQRRRHDGPRVLPGGRFRLRAACRARRQQRERRRLSGCPRSQPGRVDRRHRRARPRSRRDGHPRVDPRP